MATKDITHGRPYSSDSPSLAFSFEPPLKLELENNLEHELWLAGIAANTILPRLLDLHRSVAGAETLPDLHPGESEVSELARLVVKPEGSEPLQYVLDLREAGLTLDDLHVELLEPTARHLGDMWNEDKLDFLDVSIGLNGLQHLLHIFAGLDSVEFGDQRQHALIVTVPGEQHMLGNYIVQRFIRAAGWHVCSGGVTDIEYLIELVSHEWFGIVGLDVIVLGVSKPKPKAKPVVAKTTRKKKEAQL